MEDMLTLAAHLPEVSYAPAETVVQEGTPGGQVWVLVDGALTVTKNGQIVNTIVEPGALIGEMSILLGGPYGATVTATTPCRLRYAADGKGFLASDPAVTTLLAIGLAERLNFVTTYLADLKHQYGDAPGLSMIPEVLQRLAGRRGPPARPGSRRDPDPEY